MFKNLNKKISVMLSAVLLAACISGCDDNTNTGSNNENEKFTPVLDTSTIAEINIIGNLSNFEALENVITDFNSIYPNCSINYSEVTDYDNMLESRLMSDDSVGIFMSHAGIFEKSEYISENVLDLSKENIDFSAIRTEAIESCFIDGKQTGMPLAYNTTGLTVNCTLLEKEGLEIPKNYSEFVNVCDKLLQDGYTPIQAHNGTVYDYLVKNMFYTEIFKNDKSNEKINEMCTGTDGCCECVRPVFEKMDEFFKKGYISEEINNKYEDVYNDSIMKFFEGDVAFWVTNTNGFSGTKKRETKSEAFSASPFEYKFIYAPLADDGGYAYIDIWSEFSVNGNCPDKEWAVEFLRFLSTEDEINKIASVKGLPSVAINNSDERFSDVYEQNEENTYIKKNSIPNVIYEAYAISIRKLAKQEMTVDETIKEMERILREGKDNA